MTTWTETEPWPPGIRHMASRVADRADADARLALAKEYYVTFTSPSGQRVLDHLKERAFFGRSIMTAPIEGQPLDVPRCFVHEGRRTVVLDIMAQIELGRRGELPRAAARTTETDEEG